METLFSAVNDPKFFETESMLRRFFIKYFAGA